MGEVADLSAGPLHDLPIGVDELVHLDCERRNVLRKFAFDAIRFSPSDSGDPLAQHAKRPQSVADGERRRTDQRHRERQEGPRERPFEAALLRLDDIGVGGHLDEKAPLFAGVDLALDHTQFVSAGSDDIAAENVAVIRRYGDEMGQLRGEKRRGGPDFRGVGVHASDLPVPPGKGEFELRRDSHRGRRRALGLLACRQIGDQRLQIDAELVIEIGLSPAGVERAQS